jgi:hypothetical protein
MTAYAGSPSHLRFAPVTATRFVLTIDDGLLMIAGRASHLRFAPVTATPLVLIIDHGLLMIAGSGQPLALCSSGCHSAAMLRRGWSSVIMVENLC